MRTGLEEALEQGLVRSDIDLDRAARQCQALMYGLQAQWLFDPTTDMVATFDQFLDGLRRTHPPAPAAPRGASPDGPMP
jgi:hypothetical protein